MRQSYREIRNMPVMPPYRRVYFCSAALCAPVGVNEVKGDPGRFYIIRNAKTVLPLGEKTDIMK